MTKNSLIHSFKVQQLLKQRSLHICIFQKQHPNDHPTQHNHLFLQQNATIRSMFTLQHIQPTFLLTTPREDYCAICRQLVTTFLYLFPLVGTQLALHFQGRSALVLFKQELSMSCGVLPLKQKEAKAGSEMRCNICLSGVQRKNKYQKSSVIPLVHLKQIFGSLYIQENYDDVTC